MNKETNKQNNDAKYDVEQLQLLDDLQHVRKRAGTYIGDLGTRGLHHLVHEVLDNSLDEAMAGFADSIEIIVQHDHSVTIRDNGRGIPVAMDPRIGVSALEGVMTRLKYGGKFDDSAYDSSGGLNGMGMKAVNFLSQWCRVAVRRDGKTYQQSYTVGKPDSPVAELPAAEHGFAGQTGTEVSFLPDADKFGELVFDPNLLRLRIQNAAFINRGISIRFLDTRHEIDETYHYDRGVIQWVEHQHQSVSVLHQDVIHLQNTESGVTVDFAFQYNLSAQENIQSYANNIHNEEGGTHLVGFRNALGRTLLSYAKREKLLKETKLIGSDLREGLTAIIAIRVSQPQFESQNKGKLTSPIVEKAVSSIVSKHLSVYWEEHPETARSIIQKAIVAAKSRLQAIEYRKKLGTGSQSFGGLPGKLRDCSSRDAKRCEIYLVEGDSAGGSAEGGRLREFQAILPLRGRSLTPSNTLLKKYWQTRRFKASSRHWRSELATTLI